MISKHASQRMQQRGVPPLVVNWLLDYGRACHDHCHGIVYYFDKRSRRALQRAAGRRVVARLADYLDCYAVVSEEGTLVTVGHRHKGLHLN